MRNGQTESSEEKENIKCSIKAKDLPYRRGEGQVWQACPGDIACTYYIAHGKGLEKETPPALDPVLKPFLGIA